jgi:8-oxo-dGTP pyrophosphatase MutT (NUDIX family)
VCGEDVSLLGSEQLLVGCARRPRISHPEAPRVRLASAGSSGTQGGCNGSATSPTEDAASAQIRRRQTYAGGFRMDSEEVSAGGVVVRDGDVLVIVPKRRAADGRAVLALPKGHPENGETPEQAAQREVREEGGVEAELLCHLGDVRYSYRRAGVEVRKRVPFYLFRYRAGDPADHDHEIESARWMPLADAATALSYEGEREMVAKALSQRAADR